VSNIRTLDEMVTASLATRRMTMMLIATFAVLALVLAVAGVYGVLAYSVARRTSEIGIRIALGARHRGVLWLVVLQGLRPVVAGVHMPNLFAERRELVDRRRQIDRVEQ